jgi:predicted DNA-binding protein
MGKPKVQRRKRTGIFIYCSEEMKKRINRARRYTNRTISGYVMEATVRMLEADELKMVSGRR